MSTPIMVVVLTVFLASGVFAQTGSISGTVTETGSSIPVPGATVSLKNSADSSLVRQTFTDLLGRYVLTPVDGGRFLISFYSVGYRRVPDSLVVVPAGASASVDASLEEVPLNMDAVIVSASRRKEKVVDAPGSASVVDAVTISLRPAVTPVDHLRSTGGLDIAQTGLMQQTIVARGFNNVFSTSLTMLTDNRIAAVPSLRANVPSFIPIVDEDLERIEVVRGPASALYGPNAHNGVVNLVTRSPFASRGTTVTLAGGNRSLSQGSIRHAGTLSDRVGYKVSAQYFRGRDWVYADPEEQAARQSAIDEGALADTLRIGRREEYVERFGGEARLDFILGPEATLNLTGGMNQAVSTIELTDIGASQGRDWRYTYFQTRLTFGSLFFQAFLNMSDAGDSYILRTGESVVDRSKMFVAQLQHSSELGPRQRFTYGADLLLTRPVTERTITGWNEDSDNIDEAGAYVQSETQVVPDRLDLVIAGRADHHNRLEDIVFSPRAALVYKPSPDHNVRVTYNRAYSTPNTTELFLDILGERNPFGYPSGYEIDIRGSGIPEGGYMFARTPEGNPYFHSPLNPDRSTPLPVTDVALLWPALVAVATEYGIDLTGIPAPDPSDIGVVMALLNPETREFEPVADVQDVPSLKPTITQTVEIGYKGTIGERFRAGVDVYRTEVTDFIGQFEIVTPNVFMNPLDVQAYLMENGVGAFEAAIYAGLLSQFPLGTVTPENVADPVAVVAAPRNFGNLSLWGADLSVDFMPNSFWTVSGTFSMLEKNFFAMLNGRADLSLNTPKHRGTVTVRYRNTDLGVHAEARSRWMSGFRMISGVYVGDVGAYTLFDLAAGAALPWIPGASVTVSAQNLLDRKHREFVGAPEIGLLLMGRVQYTL